LLRDGDRLADHCSRFTDKGSYHRWIAIGLIKDWIILDCSNSHPQKYSMFASLPYDRTANDCM
jgi:hypothetical protein